MKNKWSVFVDLDGTIYSNNPVEYEQNLKQFKLFCNHFETNIFLATGRHPINLIDALATISLTQGGIIALNGALVFVNGKIISSTVFEKNISEKIYHYLLQAKKSFFLFGRNQIYYSYIGSLSHKFPNFKKNYWRKNKQIPKKIKSFSDFWQQEKGIYKFVFIKDEQPLCQKDKQFFNSLCVEHGHSLPHLYEINPQDVNKGKGVKVIVDYLKLDPKKLVAFGDGENDIEMFKMMKYSVAMKKSASELKKYASAVAKDVSFPWALKELHLLIEKKKSSN